MKQFKVGDSVRLKKNLKVNADYGMLTYLKSMYFHGEDIIEEISRNGNMLLKHSPFYYSPEMLIKEKPQQ